MIIVLIKKRVSQLCKVRPLLSIFNVVVYFLREKLLYTLINYKMSPSITKGSVRGASYLCENTTLYRYSLKFNSGKL
jgi:hypothetical protein